MTTQIAPDQQISEWGCERLDVDAYLSRIGDHGPLTPTGDTLRRLHRAHVSAIPFENLDIMLGREIPLDIDSIQSKLVYRLRGGYHAGRHAGRFASNAGSSRRSRAADLGCDTHGDSAHRSRGQESDCKLVLQLAAALPFLADAPNRFSCPKNLTP